MNNIGRRMIFAMALIVVLTLYGICLVAENNPGTDGGQNKLILGASWATQSKSTEPQDALQVCEPHLDLLALPSRLLKALSASE
jgi:hypothetical protein